MTVVQAEQVIARIFKDLDKNVVSELETAFQTIQTDKMIKEYHKGFEDGQNMSIYFLKKS